MTDIIKYDEACRAVAACVTAPEAKNLYNKATAVKVYARQAKNKQLEADAFEIRKRAERRLGEIMAEQPKAQGARESGTNRGTTRVSEKPASLADAGIDKNLADRARKSCAIEPGEFEALIARGREDIYRSAERAAASKIIRKEKHQAIATKARAGLVLDSPGPFSLIYADPPWRWGHFGETDRESESGKGRTPDQHYPTLTYDEIKMFRVQGKAIAEVAFKDAALFLWCTSANMPLALDVMAAWGFTYKAHAIWDKQKTGLGLVFRNQHEPLLYGTRGNMPGPQFQPASVFSFARGRHSAKPPEVRTAIEKMFPEFDAAMRLELFARETVEGWTTYGFEADDRVAA